jgi:hypothetical protein
VPEKTALRYSAGSGSGPGDVLDSREHRLAAEEPRGFEAVDRPLPSDLFGLSEMPGDLGIGNDAPPRRVDQEERRARAAGLQPHQGGPWGTLPAFAQERRQVLDRRCREEDGERHLAAEAGADLPDQLDGEDRVPAEGEEVVPHRERSLVEEILPEPDQLELDRVARRDPILPARCLAAGAGGSRGAGERGAQGGNEDQAGDHPLGEGAAEEGPEVGGRHGPVGIAGDPGDEALDPRGVRPPADRGLAHRGVAP